MADDITIILLEVSWSDSFKVEADFRPEASVYPYLAAFATNCSRTPRVIYRQVRSATDLRHWVTAAKGAQVGRRIFWIAGHGEWDSRDVVIRAPDPRRKKKGNLIRPAHVRKALSGAGEIAGVVVDSCSFGCNEPEAWLPKNVCWALAYAKPVDWSYSVFFGLKLLEWMIDHPQGLPAKSQQAMERADSRVRTGGIKKKRDRIDARSWADALGARFIWKQKKSSWRRHDLGSTT